MNVYIQNHINKIKSLLKNAGFRVIKLKTNKGYDNDYSPELSFSCDSIYVDGWKYFSRRLAEDGVMAAFTTTDKVVMFNFEQVKGEDSVIKNLFIFMTLLKRRYYEVSPVVASVCCLDKPTHDCNLNCKYCYDRRFAEIVKECQTHEAVDKLFCLLSKYTSTVDFIWHGGEPTLMGIKWYEYVYEFLVPKYPMLRFQFSMMTNGIKLNNNWLKHLRKYNVSIGMSYNYGSQMEVRGGGVSDVYTQDEQFDLPENLRTPANVNLLHTLKSFCEYKKPIGVIDVITKVNCERQIEIYEFYKDMGTSVSLNPIFHTDRTKKFDLEEETGKFTDEFMKYFRHWLYDIDGEYEREAAEMLSMVAGAGGNCCRNIDCRFHWISVNPIGDIYPCDRYLSDKYIIGNISEISSLADMFRGESFLNYYNEVSQRLSTHCKECGYTQFCNGGCNSTAFEATGSVNGICNDFCSFYKAKFDAVYDELRNLDLSVSRVNQHAFDILLKCNFYSVLEIKRILNSEGFNISLKYDKDNLMNCSEFSFFSNINYQKSCFKSLDKILTPEDIDTDNKMRRLISNKHPVSALGLPCHCNMIRQERMTKDSVEFNRDNRQKDLRDLLYGVIYMVKYGISKGA
jgi:uncharacterized protein